MSSTSPRSAGAAGGSGTRHDAHDADRQLAWVLLAATVAAAVFVRFRLLGIPLERDEGEYAYGGQLLLDGESMYSHLYTMKLPGTHAAYALGMAVFGRTIEGVHLTYLAANLAAIALTGLVARRFAVGFAGLVAAAAYAATSVSPPVLGPSAHATHFVIVPALGGVLVLGRALERGGAWRFASAGLCFGLAVQMKQAGALLVLFGAGWLLATEVRRRPFRFATLAARTGLFAAGVLAPHGVTCLLVWKSGAWDRFWFWTVDYSREYASEVPLAQVPARFWIALRQVTAPARMIWALAALGLAAPLVVASARRGALLRAAWFAASLAAVCPGFFFRPHYFVLVLPAVAILAGTALAAARDLAARLPAFVRLVPLAAAAVAVVSPFTRDAELLFELPPRHVSRRMYVDGTNPFPEIVDVAHVLTQIATQEDAVVVSGSEPELYFYMGRVSSTGYIYTYPLAEKQRYARQMAEEMETEIRAARPKYVVIVFKDTDAAQSGILYGAEYELVGLVETPPDGSPSAFWFAAARDRVPATPFFVAVLRRRG